MTRVSDELIEDRRRQRMARRRALIELAVISVALVAFWVFIAHLILGALS